MGKEYKGVPFTILAVFLQIQNYTKINFKKMEESILKFSRTNGVVSKGPEVS